MAISQPTAENPLNSPDHSLSHRVFANDSSAPVKSVVVDADGQVGIGIDTPTAHFHVKAGTAEVGTAPHKLTSGVLLTVPEAGAMEFDGTGIYLTPTNHRRFISLASDSIIATVTATTVASTTLWTGITNANELKPYRVYSIHGCGLFTTQNANDQAVITISLGESSIVVLTTPKAVVTNQSWHSEKLEQYHLLVLCMVQQTKCTLWKNLQL
jgi:hypothetical protein